MKKLGFMALAAALIVSGCQSVPAERKNNCACNWEDVEPIKHGEMA